MLRIISHWDTDQFIARGCYIRDVNVFYNSSNEITIFIKYNILAWTQIITAASLSYPALLFNFSCNIYVKRRTPYVIPIVCQGMQQERHFNNVNLYNKYQSDIKTITNMSLYNESKKRNFTISSFLFTWSICLCVRSTDTTSSFPWTLTQCVLSNMKR
jgi:hypothetical protein